jgi:hypothetical protein
MFRGRRAALAAALAIAAAAGVSTGCAGGSSSHALALDPVAAAATKTQAAGAARVRVVLALGSSQLQGKTVRLRGSGAIAGKSSELSFDLGPLLRQARASGLSPALALPSGGSTVAKEIFLEQDGDYVLYVRLGLLSSQLPGGERWVKLDISKLGKAAGVDLEQLLSGSQLQPSDVLSLLMSNDAKVRKLGPATVGGAVTTHYRVTVDVAKALQETGIASPLVAGTAAKLPALPADVWIGKDGLVRRVHVSYGVAHSGKRVHVAMTINLVDHGAHVSITAPPSSSVFDATQLAEMGIGSSLTH